MRTPLAVTCAALALPLVLSGCTAPAGTVPAIGQLVLATADDLGEFNPVAGYSSNGVSPLYEGLLRPAAADDTKLPALEPALAAEAPQVSEDARTWTVRLREGVRFHDGTDLDAGDVAATYRAVLDPASASPVADDYRLIARIDTPDALTVRFHLDVPNREFASRLLLGIAPSERLVGGPAADSSLNTDPAGTGPFQLEQLSPTEAVLVANPGYRDGAPDLDRVVLRSVPDDNARAQQLLAGQVDGAALPPRLADSVDGRDGVTVQSVNSADWRGVSLPVDHPFTGEAVARRALNMAVDREALVEQVLSGHGQAATTPITSAYPEYHQVAFGPVDPATRVFEASALLQGAGWELNDESTVRSRDGQRAELTVAYPVNDSLRRELASAFADQVRAIGVDVTLWGASWDEIEARADQVAIMLGGGDNPYTVDTQARRALHSRTPASGPFDNPGGWTNPGIDQALDALTDPANTRSPRDLYAQVQDEYRTDPGYVVLATLSHTYATRDTGYSGPAPILEPHAHGVTWGPWWSLGDWTATP
ncbi:UNVERIFIED_ORG: peptide/nickel transport system substrate-binding protein [Dietzia maris]|uniref:ABC transporter substrate-binding protein n=1 Tax=Dietzia maris TaxID=37915 RepID=UPI0010E18D3C